MSYEGEKLADWSSTLKVNFANQIESIVTARLTSRNPRFIVSLRQFSDKLIERYYKAPKGVDPEQDPERKKFKAEVLQWSEAIQDYLNFAFDEYGYNEKVRRAAKAMVRYGNVYGTVSYKRDVFRKKRNGKIEEVPADEYPVLDIISWTEMLMDPRFIRTQDSEAVIRQSNNVRLAELKRQDNLINLDKVTMTGSDQVVDENKQAIYSIRIGDTASADKTMKTKRLNVDKYYGYFSITGKAEDEKIYEIWTLNDTLLIKFQEIPSIPVISAGCFEDMEQHFATGYVEPILGLQEEYNFKINSAIEYINHSLNRSYWWDPNSGVDPRSLQQGSAPGGIIPVNKGMQAAEAGIKEMEHRDINNSYFSNQNEIRRDLQSLSFTVDTTAPTGQQGFTNTATAVRARFFESNVMYADTLKHLEEFLVQIAYRMLDSIAEHAKHDVVVSKLGEKRFKFLKREIFEDAPLRYAIRVEVGSSSFDNIESRREEALAFMTLAERAQQQGLDVKFDEVFKDVALTFEKRSPERYIRTDAGDVVQLLQGQQGAGQTTQAQAETIAGGTPSLQNPEELTQAVVQGGLTQ